MASISIAGDTSGAVVVAAPSVAGSSTLTLPAATDTLVGKATTDTLTNKILQPSAGTSTAGTAPIKFTSGTNLTTAEAGAVEYDGTAFYGSVAASARGVIPSEQFICSTATFTLTSTTNSQAAFNSPTNGTLTVAGSTTYFFESMLNLSSMSGTSGNMGFSIVGAGTATFTSAAWMAIGLDASTQNTAAAMGGVFSAASAETGNIVTAGTGTALSVFVKGVFRINAAGTIIPSVKLTTAATAVVGVNSWFRCYPVGTNTVVSVGQWS